MPTSKAAEGGDVGIEPLLEELRTTAIALAPGWTVTASSAQLAGDQAVHVALHHPASAGLGFVVPVDVDDPHAWLRRSLDASSELKIVEAAPDPLDHPQLVIGIRTLISAFGWRSAEVRGLAFVLFETDSLTDHEAAWLAGYCGADAPMTPQSPV